MTILSLVAGSADGQAPPARLATQRWIIERWSSDQGLPQNTVSSIAQTPDGYLWIGTYGGLVRFDGVRFTPFTAEAYPVLGSNRVIVLRVGPDSTLWIGTDHTLVSYYRGEFREHGDSAGRPAGRSTFMFVDESGVWLTTASGGLGHLPGRDATFERFTHRGVPDGWAGEIARDRSGNVWLHSRKAGFLVMRAGSQRFVAARIGANGIAATGPHTLAIAHDGNPILSTRLGHARWTGTALEPLRISGASLVRDHRGGYWSSDRRGVWHVDSLGKVEHAESHASTRNAFTMFADREGALWIGTFISGLVRLRQRVVQTYLRADGLGVEQVTAILRDSRDRLWVGSSCGATSMMTRGSFTVRRNPGCVYAITETPDGNLWFGNYGDGVTRMATDGSLSTLAHLRPSLPSTIVLALFADADNSIWIGTESGLSHYAGGKLRNYFVADGLPSLEIHFITRDRQGALWVGTGGGLARFDGSRFRAWTTRDGLPHNTVRAIHQDRDGVYWIGTYGGGITRFDGERFTTVSVAQGLYDNVVSAILEDGNGNLWMSGNRGIFRANRAHLNAFAEGRTTQVRSVGYGPSDGLLTPETNGGFQPSAWQDKDGRLWFATVRGLASIDPVVAAPRAEPPRIAIESFNVDGRAIARTGPGAIRLPVGTRYLEIAYTGLTSTAPERLAFRYKLERFDGDWVYANERRTAYYTGLPPGRYTFSVTAAGREGTWNDVPQQLSFVIPAPVLQTAWFRAVAALVAAAAAAAAVRARIARMHERERLQREFTRQVLRGQEQERGRLAGELHDSLGQDLLIMKTRATLALRAPDLPASLQPHIAEIATVAAQAVQHAREMSHGLRPHHLDNFGLAASLRDLAEHASAAGSLRVEVTADDSRIHPDHAIQLFRIAQESLSNVLKHAQAAAVTILLRSDGDGVRLLVTDDGRGLSATEPKGFGLTGIQQRVHLLGGTLAIRSVPDAGTTIDVFVPASAAPPAAPPPSAPTYPPPAAPRPRVPA
jgi:signal transduction histidine kinase/ligand-binding sensor domain-containing protein